MRPALARLSALSLAIVAAAACADDSAQDRACDARDDLAESVEDVTEDVREGNFGDARNELDDVRESYNRLRDAVTDLASEQRDELRPEVESLATDVAAAVEFQDLDELGTLLSTALGDAQDVFDDVGSSLSCD